MSKNMMEKKELLFRIGGDSNKMKEFLSFMLITDRDFIFKAMENYQLSPLALQRLIDFKQYKICHKMSILPNLPKNVYRKLYKVTRGAPFTHENRTHIIRNLINNQSCPTDVLDKIHQSLGVYDYVVYNSNTRCKTIRRIFKMATQNKKMEMVNSCKNLPEDLKFQFMVEN